MRFEILESRNNDWLGFRRLYRGSILLVLRVQKSASGLKIRKQVTKEVKVDLCVINQWNTSTKLLSNHILESFKA